MKNAIMNPTGAQVGLFLLLLFIPFFWPLTLYMVLRYATGHRTPRPTAAVPPAREPGPVAAPVAGMVGSPFRASAPTPAATAASGTKVCPDCAEEVLAAARVCRFCRHEFAPVPIVTPDIGAMAEAASLGNDPVPTVAAASKPVARASMVAVILALAVGLVIGVNAVTLVDVPAIAESTSYSCTVTPSDSQIIHTVFYMSTSSTSEAEAIAKWNALTDKVRNGWRSLATVHNAACPPVPGSPARIDLTFHPWYLGAGIVAAVATFLTIAAVRLAWKSYR